MDITVRYYPVSRIDCIKVHRQLLSTSFDNPGSLVEAKAFMDSIHYVNKIDIEYSNVVPMVVERLKENGTLRDRPHMLDEDEMGLIKLFKSLWHEDHLALSEHKALITPRILSVNSDASTVSFHVKEYTIGGLGDEHNEILRRELEQRLRLPTNGS